MSTGNYGPSLTALRLYRKTSAKGGTYFVGRWGGLKVAILKSNEVADNGDEIWNLVLSEAAPYQPRDKATAAPVALTAETVAAPPKRLAAPAARSSPAASQPARFVGRPRPPDRDPDDGRNWPQDDREPFPGM